MREEEKCSSNRKLQKIAHLFERSLEDLLKEDLNNEELEEIIEILSVSYFNHLIEKIGKRILLNDPTDNDILFVYTHIPSLREGIKNKLNKD